MVEMRFISVMAAAFIVAGPHATSAQPAPASLNAYDGQWRVVGQCSAGTVIEHDGSRLPPHPVGPFTVNVRGGQLELAPLPSATLNRATIENNVFIWEIGGTSADGAAWDYRYSGSPSSNTVITAAGVFRAGRGTEHGVRRNCQVTLTSVSPTADSLAGIAARSTEGQNGRRALHAQNQRYIDEMLRNRPTSAEAQRYLQDEEERASRIRNTRHSILRNQKFSANFSCSGTRYNIELYNLHLRGETLWAVLHIATTREDIFPISLDVRLEINADVHSQATQTPTISIHPAGVIRRDVWPLSTDIQGEIERFTSPEFSFNETAGFYYSFRAHQSHNERCTHQLAPSAAASNVENLIDARRQSILSITSFFARTGNITDTDAIVLLHPPGTGNVRQRLDGSLMISGGQAIVCIMTNPPVGYEAQVFGRWLAESVAQRLQVRVTHYNNCDPTLAERDVFILNTKNLISMRDHQIIWLLRNIEQLRRSTDLTATAFRERQTELRRQILADEAAARRIDEERASSRNLHTSQILNYSPGSSISGNIAFLIQEQGGFFACHYTRDTQEADRRHILLHAIANDPTLVAAEPLLRNLGQVKHLQTADETFTLMQSRECRIIFGSPSDLRPLLEGIARVGNRPTTVGAVIFSRDHVNRVVGLESERRAQVAAQQAQAREQSRQEAERQANDRQRRGVTPVSISCADRAGNPRPVFQCLMGRSGSSPGGSITLRDAGQSRQWNWLAVQQNYAASPMIDLELRRPWSVSVQAGPQDFFVLRVSAIGPRGQTISEEVSGFRAATITE